MRQRRSSVTAAPRAAVGILAGAAAGAVLLLVMSELGALRFSAPAIVALVGAMIGAMAGAVVGWLEDGRHSRSPATRAKRR